MRRSQHTVDAASVPHHADQLLEPLLGTWPVVRTCTLAIVVRLRSYAASRITSLFDACAALRDAPDSDTVLGHLARPMVDRDTLDRRVRGVLAASRPRALRHGCWAVAVDTTHIPYHGRPLDDEDELFRSQAKGGTTRSHANATANATAFATRNGLRFTRATLPVRGRSFKLSWSSWPISKMLSA